MHLQQNLTRGDVFKNYVPLKKGTTLAEWERNIGNFPVLSLKAKQSIIMRSETP